MRVLAAVAVIIALGAALDGCSGSRNEQASHAAKAAERVPTGPDLGNFPQLIDFRRAVGFDPLSSELTVYASGRAVAVITYGGLNGEKKHLFTLAPAQLRRLRDLVGHARLRNTTCCNVNLYIYWIIARSGSARLQQGRIPRRLEPLIRELNAILDAHINL